jgi:hypothetical protein
MLDITTITTNKIPRSISILKESINSIKLSNESLIEKNETLQKLLIVSLIIIPILGFSLYQKKQINKKANQ